MFPFRYVSDIEWQNCVRMLAYLQDWNGFSGILFVTGFLRQFGPSAAGTIHKALKTDIRMRNHIKCLPLPITYYS